MDWSRSSRCDSGDCLEIKPGAEMVGMRDSNNPATELWFTADEWAGFVAGVRAGEFDDI